MGLEWEGVGMRVVAIADVLLTKGYDPIKVTEHAYDLNLSLEIGNKDVDLHMTIEGSVETIYFIVCEGLPDISGKILVSGGYIVNK